MEGSRLLHLDVGFVLRNDGAWGWRRGLRRHPPRRANSDTEMRGHGKGRRGEKLAKTSQVAVGFVSQEELSAISSHLSAK